MRRLVACSRSTFTAAGRISVRNVRNALEGKIATSTTIPIQQQQQQPVIVINNQQARAFSSYLVASTTKRPVAFSHATRRTTSTINAAIRFSSKYNQRFFTTTRIRFNEQDTQTETATVDTNGEMQFQLSEGQEHPSWLPTNKTIPRNFWKNLDNQRSFFDWAAQQLNITSFEGWYDVMYDDIVRLGGRDLLATQYGDSLSEALTTLYPNNQWLPWRFKSGVPLGYWSNARNHRKFFDWAEAQLKITKKTDWYQCVREDIYGLGGKELLEKYYDASLQRALTAIYITVEWQPWKFQHAPTADILQNYGDLRKYVSYLSMQLRIKTLDEWYRVSMDQIRHLGGYNIITQNGGLAEVLKRQHPEYPWDDEKFKQANTKTSSQRWLRVALEGLFPDEDVIEDYTHLNITFKEKEGPAVLDMYIPSRRLAFMYHHEENHLDLHVHGVTSDQQILDREHAIACKEADVTLIIVPYWWDRTQDSLISLIRSARPDITFANDPYGNEIRIGAIPASSEPGAPLSANKALHATRSWASRNLDPVMLSNNWDGVSDLSGWWMSEKLDGVRAYWDGTRLISRMGKEITAPESFIEGLPKHIELDGEIWLDRGKMSEVMAVTKKNATRTSWEGFKFCLFDAPSIPGGYESRLAVLYQLASSMLPPHVEVIPARQCKDKEDMQRFMDEIRRIGGEGIMLRKPGSIYEFGRSLNMLKVKIKQDCEVKVIGVQPTNWGLKCEQPDKQTIVVHCSSVVYHNPPEPGSIATVSYDSMGKNGRIRNPYFLGVRTDITWEQCIEQWNKKRAEEAAKAAAALAESGGNANNGNENNDDDDDDHTSDEGEEQDKQ